MLYTYAECKERYKTYKEIVSSYRKIVYELDIQAVQEDAMRLPKSKLVMNTLQLEVF